MSDEIFRKPFTQQEPLPEAAIARAVEVMRHGRLHRYNTLPGEHGEVADLEVEFADFTGARFALAVASGGYALACALRAIELKHGEKVLTNAFTLAPVPGAIASVGGVPVLVEVTEDLVIDLDDLEAKADQARVLMLSHMRGHICDMDRLMAIAGRHGLTVIEDCAHTMGAAWKGTPSGRHGLIGCYSTQTYKHMNSGEGGLIVSDDPMVMARAILLSGSYMLYPRHRAAPANGYFEHLKYDTPNVSGRMDNLRAAILRPQLADLPAQIARWNALYRRMEAGLADLERLQLVARPEGESFVGSSFQFRLPGFSAAMVVDFITRCLARGVELKWFGAREPMGFTSRHESWRYVPEADLPRAGAVLDTLVDMRLPLSFDPEDISLISRIIRAELLKTPVI
ncbi:DegT/DnrJ/EryC1/StrS family aminotransferase [Thioclava sp. 'Guangxiensis']|uniref:DegT/DnrJ/EryC1/StrS family aminotransferase n=1 Tax=Thioclava sp. 'Guangxiensis' TaxID=3149044 RepID=UPI003878106E